MNVVINVVDDIHGLIKWSTHSGFWHFSHWTQMKTGTFVDKSLHVHKFRVYWQKRMRLDIVFIILGKGGVSIFLWLWLLSCASLAAFQGWFTLKVSQIQRTERHLETSFFESSSGHLCQLNLLKLLYTILLFRPSTTLSSLIVHDEGRILYFTHHVQLPWWFCKVNIFIMLMNEEPCLWAFSYRGRWCSYWKLTPLSKAGYAEQLCTWLPPLTSFSLFGTDRLW